MTRCWRTGDERTRLQLARARNLQVLRSTVPRGTRLFASSERPTVEWRFNYVDKDLI